MTVFDMNMWLKPIVGYEDKYSIDEHGNVYSKTIEDYIQVRLIKKEKTVRLFCKGESRRFLINDLIKKTFNRFAE